MEDRAIIERHAVFLGCADRIRPVLGSGGQPDEVRDPDGRAFFGNSVQLSLPAVVSKTADGLILALRGWRTQRAGSSRLGWRPGCARPTTQA